MTKPNDTQSSRKACIEDFLCEYDDSEDYYKNQQTIYNTSNNNNNRSHNDNDYIQKNQQHYGPRKRIKP